MGWLKGPQAGRERSKHFIEEDWQMKARPDKRPIETQLPGKGQRNVPSSEPIYDTITASTPPRPRQQRGEAQQLKRIADSLEWIVDFLYKSNG